MTGSRRKRCATPRTAIRPTAPSQGPLLVPPRPAPEPGFGVFEASRMLPAPADDFAAHIPAKCGEDARSAAGDVDDECGDGRGVVALQEVGGHSPLPGAADVDRVEDPGLALLARLQGAAVEPEIVQVGAGDALGVDRLQRVTGRAGVLEELLAVLELAVGNGVGQSAGV